MDVRTRVTRNVADVVLSGVLSDETLMAQIAEGDSDALETLYDRYASAVMGLAMKMLNERTAAEEVVQETFWRVWYGARSFRPEQSQFSAWMFRITRNLCIDRWRRWRVRPESALDISDNYEDRLPSTHPEDHPDEAVWVAARRAQIRQALAVLPQAQRKVIELAYFWGLTRQQISRVLDVPLGTVHTRTRLALDKLRDALKHEDFGHE